MIDEILNYLTRRGVKHFKIKRNGAINELHLRNPPNPDLYNELRAMGLQPHPKNKHRFLEAE